MKVAEAPEGDVGLGRARLGKATCAALGVEGKEIVELVGKKSSAAKVFRMVAETERDLVRIDGLVRRNLGVEIGDEVRVRKADVTDAERITMAPILSEGHKISFGQGIENFVKRGLLKRPVTKGDVVIVPGIALMGGALPFMVTRTDPGGVVLVTLDTVVDLLEKPVQEAEALPGLDSPVDGGGPSKHLTEECTGIIQELLAALTIAASQVAEPGVQTLLEEIQHALIRGSTELAAETGKPGPSPRITQQDVDALDSARHKYLREVDRSVTLPGDGGAAYLHLAAAISGRANRSVAALGGARGLSSPVRAFFDTLPRLLFAMAAWVSLHPPGPRGARDPPPAGIA